MPDRARRPTVARDRIIVIGLSEAEVALVRTAGAGLFELVMPSSMSPLTLEATARFDVVCVVSWAWWTGVCTVPEAAQALARLHFVLLVPQTPAPEMRRRLAASCPNALPVFTHDRASPLAMSEALRAVRHRMVADALRARLEREASTPDLRERALAEAVRLLPHERVVATLARALFHSERTLRRHLHAIHPDLTPHAILRFAALLHAAWYLSATDESFGRVAQRVGASDASNLRRLLRRVTGLTPRVLAVQSDDPVDLLLALWRARILPPR